MTSKSGGEPTLSSSRRLFPGFFVIFAIAGSLALGGVGGYLFNLIQMPLAWMIGAMLFCTVAALAGVPVRGSNKLRLIMVPVLGIMLGSAFTPETLQDIALWVPSLLVLIFFVIAVIGCVGLFLYKVMEFGPITAYFSASPGGLATMAIIGAEMGGDERRISLTHSIRIMLTVLIIPFYFRFFEGYVPGVAGTFGTIEQMSLRDGLILGACWLGFPLAKFLRIPSAQILGPMILSATVHMMGLTIAKPPGEIVNLAQLVIGTGIGARFVGVSLVRLSRVMIAAAVSTVFMILLAAAAANGLSAYTGLPFQALWLAFSPGGLAEMTLISLAMHIDTALVSTHHVVRVTVMVMLAPIIFNYLKRRWNIIENRDDHPF